MESNNETYTEYQRYILGRQECSSVFKVVGNTLYHRAKWVRIKGLRGYKEGWYPILTKDGEDWLGYNYSSKPCLATQFLHTDMSWRYKNLKWIELGRGIGGRGTTRLWDMQWRERSVITKMINPTMDMILPIEPEN